jgi:alkylated DNA repair protein alkB family protein 1
LCDDFRAEAGIVNFYQPGDSLTGHVDRSEQNMDVPLVSFSLGASCIFLLGGKSREEEVLPILLHSGDCVFLNGNSRLYYHGVCRILDGGSDLEGQTEKQKTALKILGNGRVNLNMRQVK